MSAALAGLPWAKGFGPLPGQLCSVARKQHFWCSRFTVMRRSTYAAGLHEPRRKAMTQQTGGNSVRSKVWIPLLLLVLAAVDSCSSRRCMGRLSLG